MRFNEALMDTTPEIVRCKDCNLPGIIKYVTKADGGVAFPPMFYFDHNGKKCLKQPRYKSFVATNNKKYPNLLNRIQVQV